MKHVSIVALTAFLASFSACGGHQKLAPGPTERIAGIVVEEVTLSPVDDYYEAVGTVRARTVSVLSARTLGTVLTVRVSEGDRVKTGQTLIEIDNREGLAQLQKAQAGHREAEQALEEVDKSMRAAEAAKAGANAQKELATATFARYRSLLERRSVSQQEFDEVLARNRVAEADADRANRLLDALTAKRTQALARIDQAKADVASAQTYASYSRIVSPLAGIVTVKQTDIGQTATPGGPLLTVEDDSRYQLEVAVEESRLSIAHRGDVVRVAIDALGDEVLDGKVDEIVPASDPTSRSFTFKINLPTPANQRRLRSGMFGKARFTTTQRQAVLVPQKAIARRGQLVGVYVVDQARTARLRLITIGKQYGDRVEVLSGLSQGERIVSAADGVLDGSTLE